MWRLGSPLLFLLFACGSTEPSAATPARVDDGALGDWIGDRPASPPSSAVPRDWIELDGGERLVAVWAISTSQLTPEDGPSEAHCALYGLRVETFEEGRERFRCGELPPDPEVALVPIDQERVGHLRQALTGAVLSDQVAALEGATVLVRVETNRRAFEGRVPQAEWPTPYQAEPRRAHPPSGLPQLWEALMFPERYTEGAAQ